MSPIMFILLFAYVFGSAIQVPGLNYREFLIPGIFAQTVIFGATITGAALADDMQKGIIDRFRSLPMSRSALLVGRTGSDVINNVIAIVIMSLTGLAIGWRIRSSVLDAVAGFLLLNSVKIAYRAQAWNGGTASSLSSRVTLWFDLAGGELTKVLDGNLVSIVRAATRNPVVQIP